jgi:hypothetical protein
MKKFLSCACGKTTPTSKKNFVARDFLIEDLAKSNGMKIYSFMLDCICGSTLHLNLGKDAQEFNEIVNGAREKIKFTKSMQFKSLTK